MADALYVTTDQLKALVGAGADPARLDTVCVAASAVVDHYYGTVTVAAKLRQPDGTALAVVPPVVAEAALTIAADLWRRPTTPGGYFSVADYVGRLAQDPASSVVALLNALGREAWPVS